MSANSLPAFPTELIVQILKSTNNFSTATALSSTCRIMQSTWKTNRLSICHTILVSTITCYDQAFEYVRAQPLDATSSEQIEDMGLLVVTVTKQFCENADIACLALRHYENQVIGRVCRGKSGPSSLTEAQRTCFLQAWYRIHTLASLAGDSLPYDMLASLDLLDFQQMMEALWWLMYWCPNEHRFELRITYQHGCPEDLLCSRRLPKSPISAERWKDLTTRLVSLNSDLHASPFDNRCLKPGQINFWQSMVHECSMDIRESGKGISLADMLPLIKERNTPHQLYKLSSWTQVQ